MSNVNLLGDRPAVRLFSEGSVKKLKTNRKIAEAVEAADADTLWVVSDSELTDNLLWAVFADAKQTRPSRNLGRLLILDQPRPQQIPPLEERFCPVAWEVPTVRWLPDRELADAMRAPGRADLVIGGYVDQRAGLMTLFRGDLTRVTAPLDFFKAAGNGIVPDFGRFSVSDYGHTIRLGIYESAVDAVLYDVDLAFRTRMKARRRESDKGFGASLRRLRIQRGLRQEDFEPAVRRETIVRLERARTKTPHRYTRELIAERLGVRPEQVEDF